MRDPRTWTASSGPGERGKAATYTGDRKARLAARANKRWVRLMTVLVYVLSVSLFAVILSLYYGLVWTPTAGPETTHGRTGTSESGQTRCKGKSDTEVTVDFHTDSTEPEKPVPGSGDLSPGPTAMLHPVPPAGPFEPSQPEQDCSSPASSSTESPPVTAEDPSNLPTHRYGVQGGEPERPGSGSDELVFTETSK
ncbi:uncharacterized protein LOC122862673 [Xyrichtys novacula]|uniref:Uncharacterized protein LOC122862673 n=1 Tax=Xyrichtys novacula TaxID=13765 RepID=A0AAV1GWV3_XYRNO|nr:uncharacterized protein LOC122862673 [Xyrichtys novacula]